MCPGPFPNLGAGPGNAATSFTCSQNETMVMKVSIRIHRPLPSFSYISQYWKQWREPENKARNYHVWFSLEPEGERGWYLEPFNLDKL